MGLPRMRTIAAAHQEITEADPNSGLTQNQLRVMVKTGKIPHVSAGKHILINLDILIDYLNSPEYQRGEPAQAVTEYGKLRRVEE